MNILIPVSAGELYDKVTILNIKLLRIVHKDKRDNVFKEYLILRKICNNIENELNDHERIHIHSLSNKLLEVNTKLWDIEDKVRALAKRIDDFKEKNGAAVYSRNQFSLVALEVPKLNHERFLIKNEISRFLKSDIVEEKQYFGEGDE